MASFFIKTFGCQFNELYSGAIADALLRAGNERTLDLGKASLVIINSCAVRKKSEDKALSFLGEAAKVLDARHIVFMGCVASLDRERPLRIAGHGLTTIDGSKSLDEILEILGKLVSTAPSDRPPRSLFPTADIELIRGCESYCTYCIVPRSRGREVAVDSDRVLQSVKSAVEEGFSELLFLGQNINKYHSQAGGLVDMMSLVDRTSGSFWFWFLSPHPANFRPDEVRRLMQLKRIEHRLHLPLQSGSDRILERMNRRYTLAQYAELAKPVRDNQEWALTTDVIVGFPGETDDDFARTVDAVQRFQFDGVFLAKYSDRPGTPSSRMQDKVPRAVIDERHSTLLRIVQDLSEQSNEKMTGHLVDVLVLSLNEAGGGFGRSIDGRNVWFGRTEYQPVVGSFLRVMVDHASREGLYGTALG